MSAKTSQMLTYEISMSDRGPKLIAHTFYPRNERLECLGGFAVIRCEHLVRQENRVRRSPIPLHGKLNPCKIWTALRKTERMSQRSKTIRRMFSFNAELSHCIHSPCSLSYRIVSQLLHLCNTKRTFTPPFNRVSGKRM